MRKLGLYVVAGAAACAASATMIVNCGGKVESTGDADGTLGDYGYAAPYPLDCGYAYADYGYAYGEGYGYSCRVASDALPRHRIEAIPAGGALDVPFVWREAAGRAAPDDLTVTLDGSAQPVFQVFSNGARVFARAGFDVKVLHANAVYHVVIDREPDGIHARLETQGNTLFHSVKQPLGGEPYADFATPGPYFRQNVGLR